MEVRGHKALKTVPATPGSSTRTEIDDVFTKQDDIGEVHEAGAARHSPTRPAVDGPGSQHTRARGKLIYTECKLIGCTA